jgi:hypothetical protein
MKHKGTSSVKFMKHNEMSRIKSYETQPGIFY